jgi:hypothetical protein
LIRNDVVFTISLFFIDHSITLELRSPYSTPSPELFPEGDPIPSSSVETTGRDEGTCFSVPLFALHSRLSE